MLRPIGGRRSRFSHDAREQFLELFSQSGFGVHAPLPTTCPDSETITSWRKADPEKFTFGLSKR